MPRCRPNLPTALAALVCVLPLLSRAQPSTGSEAPRGAKGPLSAPSPTVEHDGAGPLLLAEVLASTVRHYPLIAASQQEVEAARMELLGAQGGFDPELKGRFAQFPFGPYEYTRLETTVVQPTPFFGAQLFGGWRLGAGDIPLYYGNVETNRYGELRAGVTVPLWRGRETDRRRASQERAELAVGAAELSADQAQLEALRAAAMRYWDWVAAGQRLRIARSLLEIAKQRDAQLATRVRRGDVAAFDRTDNLRALVQREAQVVATERALQQAALELSLFARDSRGDPLVLPPTRQPQSFPEPQTVQTLLQGVDRLGAVDRRPDVLRALAQLAQQRVEERLATNLEAPLIDLTVAAAKDLGPGPPKLGRTELELGLAVDLPLLNRGARGRAGALRASIARADAALQLQRERAHLEARDAILALEASYQRVLLARLELEAARELERGERTRFAQGDSTLVFVNLREQNAGEAAVREVDALADHFKSKATLRAALAEPYPYSLQEGR